MKIQSIQVRNILGVVAIDIAPDTPITLVAGGNGAAKSSLRDAIDLALTGELQRGVSLKKHAAQLLHNDAPNGEAVVTWRDEAGKMHSSATRIAAGKVTSDAAPAPALRYVLRAQTFATMPLEDRRRFLLGLMSVDTSLDGILARLEARGIKPASVDRIRGTLEAKGMQAASDEAAALARDAKALWRNVTGEQWGPEKAASWRPEPVDEPAPALLKSLTTKLEHARVALGQWQQAIGAAGERTNQRARMSEALEVAERNAANLKRAEAKLAFDTTERDKQREKVERTRELAGEAPRVGMIHALASALHNMLGLLAGVKGIDGDLVNAADQVLTKYELEHGPVEAMGQHDEVARRALPEHERALQVLERSVQASSRDVQAAREAVVDVERLKRELAELAVVGDSSAEAEKQVEAQRKEVAAIEASLDELTKQAGDAKSAASRVRAAGDRHHEVVTWLAVAEALGPEGIPADLVADALRPLNERLAQSALDTHWPQVTISPGCDVAAAGRPYALLATSERWRADAMLAEAVSHLSGLRLVVLDGLDVLEPAERPVLLDWIDILVSEGEVDSALLFATLKQRPKNLPETIGVHWVDAGRIVAPADAEPVAENEPSEAAA